VATTASCKIAFILAKNEKKNISHLKTVMRLRNV
jgi:hypothetical protein